MSPVTLSMDIRESRHKWRQAFAWVPMRLARDLTKNATEPNLSNCVWFFFLVEQKKWISPLFPLF